MRDLRTTCRRFVLTQLIVVVLLAGACPFAGRLLYHEDPLQKSDAVFVLAGERVIRWLEADALVREGWAPDILLSGGYRESIEKQLATHGVHIPSEGENARNALMALGHDAGRVRVIGFADNTAAEGERLRSEVLARHYARVIVVTSKLHTRRAGFAMRRALEGVPVEIIVRATRFDDDEPAHFWRKRRTARAVMYELPKFLAYLLGLAS